MSAQKLRPPIIPFPPKEEEKFLEWMKDLVKLLQDLFNNIQMTTNDLCDGNLTTVRLEKQFAAPKGVKSGWIAYADGTSWNPGSGEGYYGYYAAAWHFLG